jgi:hypothetical protein
LASWIHRVAAAWTDRVRGKIERLPSGSFRAVAFAGVDPVSGT